MKQNQNLQIKLAQLNLAMRHVLRNRMQKKAGLFGPNKTNEEEDRYREIAKLLKQRDKGLFSDLLGGIGKGTLYGFGLGGIGGTLAGGLGGYAYRDSLGDAAGKNAENYYKILADFDSRDLTSSEKQTIEDTRQQVRATAPVAGGLLGGLLGSGLGLPTGALIGGLYRGLTHGSRRQKIIERLKELGVTDSPVK